MKVFEVEKNSDHRRMKGMLHFTPLFSSGKIDPHFTQLYRSGNLEMAILPKKLNFTGP